MKLNRMAEISVLCDYVGSRSPKNSPEEEFTYIDIAGIDREQKLIAEVKRLLGSDAPSRARQVVQTGDVLVSTVRPNLNAVAMVTEELDDEIASTGFCVLRAKEDQVLQRYLFYVTQSDGFIRYLVSRCKGAGYPAVTEKTIRTLPIFVPQLKEQARIVELLDQADALRKLRRQADKKAARIVPSLFRHYFGDRRPEGQTLGDVRCEVRYGLGQPPEKSDDGVPLIRATNISHGSITKKNLILVNPEKVPPGKNAFLKANEVIVVRSGAYAGDVAQVTEQYEGSLAGYDLVVTPPETLPGEFVEAYLLSPFVQKNYFMSLKMRAAQPHLNAKQVYNTPIFNFTEGEVCKFAHHVKSVRQINGSRISSKQKLEDLFQLLLHRAFTGELTAKWREDHMSELVEEMELQTKG